MSYNMSVVTKKDFALLDAAAIKSDRDNFFLSIR